MKSILTKSQRQTITKNIYYNGIPCIMAVTLQYDDECGNGHNTFSITGKITSRIIRGRDKTIAAGCIHKEIEKYFPEFKHLIKWHLCGSNKPLYYIENTLYHASNSTSSKYKAGEPNQWDKVLAFKDSNITHRLPVRFLEWLEESKGNTFEIKEIEHKKEKGGYEFDPKYAFSGFQCEWYQCPFDTKEKAKEYKKELETKQWEIKAIITGYQKEKPRNFEGARHSAIWEDATEEELSLPSEELKKLLIKRLPKLMKEFKKEIETLGFVY